MLNAESENKILAEISLETELRIQKMTMLLLRIHELRRVRSESSGREIEPLIKPILFFTERAMTMALLHEE